MSAINIGIQVIMPKTGTSQQPSPPKPANDNASVAAQQAPPPGMGRLVDKMV
jgi:hypothetical protein